ncbi:Si-specific NAD(P)(+) transhydrogenase, partial [bacterium]|nr:Si-specific NAD(P)(+) transhydrogenase [bacterium]
KYERGVHGVEKKLEQKTTIEDFFYRKNVVQTTVESEVRHNFEVHHVDVIHGRASFRDSHVVEITTVHGVTAIRGEYILIATGSYPFHPSGIPFDGELIHDSDTILQIKKIPQTLAIVGAGVIGCEYATIFATMGTKVHLINDRDKVMPFLDAEISADLVEHMRKSGIEIVFNIGLKAVSRTNEGLTVTLDNGSTIKTEMFLFAAGRSGSTAGLNCEAAGVKLGKREVVEVDSSFRSSTSNIFAVGDVIGFPALAATSMDQGRVAVSRMFSLNDLTSVTKDFPYGIYTVPEVSMVGMTEQEARAQNLDVCVGKANYSDMHRGRIMGVNEGFLKLVFEKNTLRVLGVHVIGPLATEIIHYGLLLVQDRKDL